MGLEVPEAFPDADVGPVELVDDALVHRLLSGPHRRVQDRILVGAEPGFSGFVGLPQVDRQHEEQVVSQDLRAHPGVVEEAWNFCITELKLRKLPFNYL